MKSSVVWVCKPFQHLTVQELYAILQLRSAIFVVEQNCVYQDLDGLDEYSHHLLAMKNDKLAAHARLLPPGVSYPEQSIGRIVVKQEERANGLGKDLLLQSIANSYRLFGNKPIKIGAQVYLKKFYESFGFEQCSEVYDEDGIEHIKMLKPLTNLSDGQ
ncbi:MAG: GNAT family N-acetyltransferase [Niabella sp.]